MRGQLAASLSLSNGYDDGSGGRDEAAWVAEAKAGSQQAFRKLVERHQDLIYGAALRLLKDPEAAEEVAQRKLRLELESLRRPQEVERRALRDPHLVAPTADDILVIETVRSASKAGVVLAAR